VSETSRNTLGKILAFAAVVEVGTGLALMIDPAIVVTLLLGAEVSGVGMLLGRCFGVALLALGIGVLAEPAARRERLAGLPGDADLQRADCAVPRLSGYVRAPVGLAVVAGRCAARRCGVVAGLDEARRATDQGDQQVTPSLIRSYDQPVNAKRGWTTHKTPDDELSALNYPCR
jgi:hypothetical protein